MSSVVPEGWERKKLGSNCKFIMGQAPSGADCNKKQIGTSFVKAGEFRQKYPIVREWTTAPLKFAKENDILICVVGATCGKLNLGVDCAIGRSVAALRPSENLDYLFLYNYLQTQISTLRNDSSGSAQSVITTKDLADIPLPIPPLPEQKKIASILTSVDEVIENTQKQIDKLQDLKKATMNELLTKGIGHTEFKDSELGRIPKSWEVVTLKDYCKRVCVGFVGTCEPYYRPTGIPLIRTGDLKGGLSEIVNGKYVTKEFHEKEKKSQLVSGDLLIARHGDFGQTCLVPESFGEANCLNIVIVRPNAQFYAPKFLKYLFNSDSMKRSFEAKAEGSTQKVISTTEISKAVFPMPTLSEQEEIVHILESLDSSIDAKRAKLSQTQSLKKSLMQDLLTGKVRVTLN